MKTILAILASSALVATVASAHPEREIIRRVEGHGRCEERIFRGREIIGRTRICEPVIERRVCEPVVEKVVVCEPVVEKVVVTEPVVEKVVCEPVVERRVCETVVEPRIVLGGRLHERVRECEHIREFGRGHEIGREHPLRR